MTHPADVVEKAKEMRERFTAAHGHDYLICAADWAGVADISRAAWCDLARHELAAKPKPADVEELVQMILNIQTSSRTSWIDAIARAIIARYGAPPALGGLLTMEQEAVFAAGLAWLQTPWSNLAHDTPLADALKAYRKSIKPEPVDPVEVGMDVVYAHHKNAGSSHFTPMDFSVVRESIRAALSAQREAGG